MFDGLSKDGLTHEALALFAQIKDKGSMPDVIGHTAVIEAYVNAGGQSKEALKTYERMLAAGVKPNGYTYSVLIRGLAADGKLKEGKKLVLEMMEKGMKPNAGTYTSLFEGFLRENKGEEAKSLLEEMREKGFVPDEKAVREHLGRRGSVFRSMMNLLFGK